MRSHGMNIGLVLHLFDATIGSRGNLTAETINSVATDRTAQRGS